MSFEEYEVLERPFGWKVEYWDGQARLTPRSMGVTSCLDLNHASTQQPGNQEYALIRVEATHAEQMIAGYFEAFADSVEFCNWPLADIQRSGERCIARYFSGHRGEPLAASVIALQPNTQELAGLALFVLTAERKPHLDLLYVLPSFQRQGIATAMLHRGVSHLVKTEATELSSAYHVCNQHSRQWHHKLGFRDVYGQHYIRLRAAWLGNEIWRKEKLGMLIGLDKLRQEQEEWQSQVKSYEEVWAQTLKDSQPSHTETQSDR